MTLPDLDTAIRAEIDRAFFELVSGEPSGFARLAAEELRDTLLVVLGLHKPNPVLTGLGPYCEKCAGGYEGVSEWPCETVREIARTLGVAVGA